MKTNRSANPIIGPSSEIPRFGKVARVSRVDGKNNCSRTAASWPSDTCYCTSGAVLSRSFISYAADRDLCIAAGTRSRFIGFRARAAPVFPGYRPTEEKQSRPHLSSACTGTEVI